MRIDKDKEQKEKFSRDEEEKIKIELMDAALEEVLVQGWNIICGCSSSGQTGLPQGDRWADWFHG